MSIGWCDGGRLNVTSVPGLGSGPAGVIDLDVDAVPELLVGGSFGRGTYLQLVAADSSGRAQLIDLGAVHTFEGVDLPDELPFTASSYQCILDEGSIRIRTLEFRPGSSDDVIASVSDVVVDTTTSSARHELVEQLTSPADEMADFWRNGGGCPIQT